MITWLDLSPDVQDAMIAMALVLPALLLGGVITRGFAPWPLVRALLWRFRWANVMFITLIAVSVGMGIAILAQERGLRQGTAQAADKFDLIVAAPGSEMTLLMAAVYLQPSNVALLDGDAYADIATHPKVSAAAPLAFGDSYRDAPVIGTTADFVRHLSDGRISGQMWTTPDHAIAGASVPLSIGDIFTPAHGFADAADADAHGGQLTITGRMGRTGTPWDRAILVPIESVWQVHGLADGHAPEQAGQLGPPFDADYFPGTPAVIVQAETLWANYTLMSEFTRSALYTTHVIFCLLLGQCRNAFSGSVRKSLLTSSSPMRKMDLAYRP